MKTHTKHTGFFLLLSAPVVLLNGYDSEEQTFLAPTVGWVVFLSVGSACAGAACQAVIPVMKLHPLPAISALTGMVVFCIIAVLWADRPLALFLHEHATEEFVSIFRIVTSLGTIQYLTPVMLAVGLGVGLFFYRHTRQDGWNDGFNRSLFYVSAWIVLSEIMSSVVVHTLKTVVGRFRPRLLFNEGLYGFSVFGGGDSFPSGHTQVIVAALLPLMILWPRLRLPCAIIIIAVGTSRLVLGAHYLSDVVVSVVVTTLCTLWVRGHLPWWKKENAW